MGNEFQATHMLNSDEIGANERDVIDLAESVDDARMVNSRNKRVTTHIFRVGICYTKLTAR